MADIGKVLWFEFVDKTGTPTYPGTLQFEGRPLQLIGERGNTLMVRVPADSLVSYTLAALNEAFMDENSKKLTDRGVHLVPAAEPTELYVFFGRCSRRPPQIPASRATADVAAATAG